MYVRSLKVAIFLLLIPAVVLGNIIEVEVTGVVDSVFTRDGFELDGSVEDGTIMTGIFIYDTQAEEKGAGFDAISIEMSVGSYSFSVSGDGESIFTVGSDNYYHVHSYDGVFDGTIYDYGVAKTYEDISWYVTDMTIAKLRTSNPDYFSGIGILPTWYPDISGFDLINEFSVTFIEPIEWINENEFECGLFDISGELTSIRIIPEPGTVLLFALAGLILLRKRRRPSN